MEKDKKDKSLKQKLSSELKDYLINASYLVFYFTVFAVYRRLVLEQYGIQLDDYGVSIIKALILAKVIMIGSFLKIGRRFEKQPLIYSALVKVALFTLFVAIFDLLEATVRALIVAEPHKYVLHIAQHFNYMWLGGLIVVFFTFIPFFALKEVNRLMGDDYVRKLLFKKHPQV
jgi:hypothetical protein